MKRFIVLLIAANLAGCSLLQSNNDEKTQPQYFTHTVAYQGETLGLVVGWYTGKHGLWKEILKCNPGLDVQRMRVGQTVRIPETLIVRREKLPQRLAVATLDSAQEPKAALVSDVEFALPDSETPSENHQADGLAGEQIVLPVEPVIEVIPHEERQILPEVVLGALQEDPNVEQETAAGIEVKDSVPAELSATVEVALEPAQPPNQEESAALAPSIEISPALSAFQDSPARWENDELHKSRVPSRDELWDALNRAE